MKECPRCKALAPMTCEGYYSCGECALDFSGEATRNNRGQFQKGHPCGPRYPRGRFSSILNSKRALEHKLTAEEMPAYNEAFRKEFGRDPIDPAAEHRVSLAKSQAAINRMDLGPSGSAVGVTFQKLAEEQGTYPYCTYEGSVYHHCPEGWHITPYKQCPVVRIGASRVSMLAELQNEATENLRSAIERPYRPYVPRPSLWQRIKGWFGR